MKRILMVMLALVIAIVPLSGCKKSGDDVSVFSVWVDDEGNPVVDDSDNNDEDTDVDDGNEDGDGDFVDDDDDDNNDADNDADNNDADNDADNNDADNDDDNNDATYDIIFHFYKAYFTCFILNNFKIACYIFIPHGSHNKDWFFIGIIPVKICF